MGGFAVPPSLKLWHERKTTDQTCGDPAAARCKQALHPRNQRLDSLSLFEGENQGMVRLRSRVQENGVTP